MSVVAKKWVILYLYTEVLKIFSLKSPELLVIVEYRGVTLLDLYSTAKRILERLGTLTSSSLVKI